MAIRRYLFPHNYNYSEKDLGHASLRHRRVSSFFRLYSPQVFTLPVVLSLIGPASLPVFPRIFEALFFDLSVFFKCLKVIIPCVSGRFFLSGSLLRRWSCHIFCRSFICASHVRQMGFDCGKFIHYRLQGFICAARDDIWIY